MKKILTLLAILVLCAGVGFAAHKKFHKENNEGILGGGIDIASILGTPENELSDFQKNAPIDIPDASIKSIHEIKDAEKPILALFYVDWCTYCRKFMPVFGEAAKEYSGKYNFAAVHCEKPENDDIVMDFGIQGFPSLYIIDKKIDYRFALAGNSTRDAESLKKELDKYLEVRTRFVK